MLNNLNLLFGLLNQKYEYEVRDTIKHISISHKMWSYISKLFQMIFKGLVGGGNESFSKVKTKLELNCRMQLSSSTLSVHGEFACDPHFGFLPFHRMKLDFKCTSPIGKCAGTSHDSLFSTTGSTFPVQNVQYINSICDLHMLSVVDRYVVVFGWVTYKKNNKWKLLVLYILIGKSERNEMG